MKYWSNPNTNSGITKTFLSISLSSLLLMGLNLTQNKSFSLPLLPSPSFEGWSDGLGSWKPIVFYGTCLPSARLVLMLSICPASLERPKTNFSQVSQVDRKNIESLRAFYFKKDFSIWKYNLYILTYELNAFEILE